MTPVAAALMHACSPVLLLIYNRPALTREVWARVRVAQPARLLVVADGPRIDRPGDAAQCAAARAVTEEIDWPCDVLREYSAHNLGLRARVSSGISWAFRHVEEAIVLEDDCVPHPSFFGFCAELLERYRDDARVVSISGDNYQQGAWRGTGSYYFSKYPTCWGWASWRRAWQHFDASMTTWPAFRDSGAMRSVCPDADEAEYWRRCFDETHAGRNQSWAYAWVYAAFSRGMVSAHPNRNLISNVGFGEGATHTRKQPAYGALPTQDLGELRHPPFVLADRDADRAEFEWSHLQGVSAAPEAPGHVRTRRLRSAARVATDVARDGLRRVATSPLAAAAVRRLRVRDASPHRALSATGEYATWQQARADSEGYDAPAILARTRGALIEVRDGRAAFERDGVLFQEPDYSWPLLACLSSAANQEGGRLRVLDFGGALGNTYFQCRSFLGRGCQVSWSVVEQPAHVACGREEFQTDELRFYASIDDALRERPADLLLLSGVLSYLPAPHALLREALDHGFEHVLVDRTPFMRDDTERLTVERVPDWIYRASYPAWFFSETRFLQAFTRHVLIARFMAIDTLQPDCGPADFKGFYFRRKEER